MQSGPKRPIRSGLRQSDSSDFDFPRLVRFDSEFEDEKQDDDCLDEMWSLVRFSAILAVLFLL